MGCNVDCVRQGDAGSLDFLHNQSVMFADAIGLRPARFDASFIVNPGRNAIDHGEDLKANLETLPVVSQYTRPAASNVIGFGCTIVGALS
ncbi:hypothetical protein [Bradyrhizobium sp. McL0616]|uniref:hypothetical protein n=1 Tax=Bradyrhizobium sp. McL0616 TaxID=3415674 RepID=UPI003CFA6A64